MAPARSFSAAVEDYLKAIYRLQAEIGGPVTTTDLGGWLGVTASSASGMLRKLDDLQLVSYEPYRGVQLSEVGWRAALRVVRGIGCSSFSCPRHWGCPGTGYMTRLRRSSTPCRQSCARSSRPSSATRAPIRMVTRSPPVMGE